MKCPVESLNKGLKLLEHLARFPEGVGLTELSTLMNLKVTTTHNLLKTLHICGYAAKMADGRYRLGWKPASLTRPTIIRLDIEGPAIKTIRDFAHTINESIVLTCLIAGQRQVLLRIQSNQMIQINSEAIDSIHSHIWQVVTGRILAAFCEKEEFAEILDISGLPGKEWNNIRSRDELEKQLTPIRQTGWAEKIEPEIASAAMPVKCKSGELFGAIGVHLPKYRYETEMRERILKEMTKCCKTLSEFLEK
jgi:DNA-binding IclR family transcriptional regulator